MPNTTPTGQTPPTPARRFSAMRTVAAAGLAAALAPAALAGPSIAVLEIEGALAERSTAPAFFAEEGQTLRGFVETLDTLALDDEFSGVLIRLKDAALGITHIEEIGQAISRVREAGKKVHLFAENFGPAEIMLGAYTDDAAVQQGGMVMLPGMHMEEMFLADTLSWVGVRAQLVQVGDYKGANEMMTRSAPSPQWNQNIEGLLDGLYNNQRSIIMNGRDMSAADLDSAMKLCWWGTADDGIKTGLVDAQVDLPDLPGHLASVHGVDEIEWVADPYAPDSESLDMSNPFAVFGQLFGSKPQARITGPAIAILHVDGTIVDGDSSSGGPFGGGSSVGSRTFRNAVEKLIDEDAVKGVVVRIDSPGGSAIASEVMWQGVQRLKEHKPVWVSVGSMAASGGYYILSAGDRVYVNPSSIVGSIGVVGGKYSMGELYDRAKINIVERSRGPAADLNSTVHPWTPDQEALVRLKMAETYQLFTSRVTAGRPGIDLSKTAEGRLFVGSDAVALNMADEVGSLDDAINDMAASLSLGDVEILDYPPAPSFEEFLQGVLGGFVTAPQLPAAQGEMASTLRAVLGEQRFDAIRESLNGMMLLRDEKVLLISPKAFIIR